ncbi:MAG TPA: YkgJ family cysteine cluster protein [Gemmataceae bacterium]|jgi:Fe-S-cluster containining protein|nr:YkgJ family cysteine cluster protein [Gemmataceae bacterium]
MMELPVVRCDGCGACCMEIGSPPGYAACVPPPGLAPYDPDDDDYRRFLAMPAELRAELTAYHDGLRAGGRGRGGSPCLWLDLETRRCRHYEWRPDCCRLFEVGCGSCLDWREKLNVADGPT